MEETLYKFSPGIRPVGNSANGASPYGLLDMAGNSPHDHATACSRLDGDRVSLRGHGAGAGGEVRSAR